MNLEYFGTCKKSKIKELVLTIICTEYDGLEMRNNSGLGWISNGLHYWFGEMVQCNWCMLDDFHGEEN